MSKIIFAALLCLSSLVHAVDQGELEAAKVSVLTLINAQRATLGLSSLEREMALENEIQIHADDMAAGRIPFGHEGFADRCANARAAMPGSRYCGEIVAWGQKTPERVHLAWTNSPGHYARMTDVRYTHAGFGYFINGQGRPYWGVLFLRYSR